MIATVDGNVEMLSPYRPALFELNLFEVTFPFEVKPPKMGSKLFQWIAPPFISAKFEVKDDLERSNKH